MRAPVLLTLFAACGRCDFNATVDSAIADTAIDAVTYPWVARYSMDDPPTSGMITGIPASYSVPCAPCPSSTAGRIAGGYSFDGTVRVPLLHPELIGRAPFSVSMWMRPAQGSSGLMSLVSKPRDLTTVLNVLSVTIFVDNGNLAFETSEGSNILAISTTIDVSRWHHVVVSWDGTTRRLFADGGLAGMDQVAFDDSTLDVAIGADLDGGAPQIFFRGDVDDLRFYDRALDQTEVTALQLP